MTDLVKAYWNCSYPVEIAGQGEIAFGDPAMIPEAEARDSDHWRLSSPPKPKTRRRRRATPAKPPKVETPPAPEGNAAITSPPTTEESA